MTTPNLVRSCAERLVERGGALDERVDRIDVRGTPDCELLADLRNAAQMWQEGGFGNIEALDSLGDAMDLGSMREPDGELRLIIRKCHTDSTFYFLTASGIPVLLRDTPRAADARRILVAEAFQPFEAVSCHFETWETMVADDAGPNRLRDAAPRRIVRDQVPITPISLGPVLLARAPASGSVTFGIWKRIATCQLLTTLCNEIWHEADVLMVTLTGPRTLRLMAELDAVVPDRDFEPANNAASWIFDSERDVEVRHTLFTYELAREWPAEIGFVAGFALRAEGALEAAKSAFRMHVRDASKDTLRSLGDLRKNLSDEVGRVVAQTRDLVTETWRDFLVVVTALIGRITLLVAAPETANLRAAQSVLIGTALFLIFSIITNVTSNASFMRISARNREVWKTKLYGFLDAGDFKQLAENPLNDTIKIYRRTRMAVGIVYLVLIVALLTAAFGPNLASKSKAEAMNASGLSSTHTTASLAPGSASVAARLMEGHQRDGPRYAPPTGASYQAK